MAAWFSARGTTVTEDFVPEPTVEKPLTEYIELAGIFGGETATAGGAAEY
jgi:hypothetical protein